MSCPKVLAKFLVIYLDSFPGYGYRSHMEAKTKKIDVLAAMMRNGEWDKAIKFAAKFPRLDKHRGAILTASSALLSPTLYEQMGRDPEALVAAGIAALKDRFQRIS